MLKLKHDIQYLTVDFLTQVHVDNWRGDRRNEIGKITAALKALAFDLDIPVILLSQLSRGSVKDSRPPRMDDLRESGDIEQDATQVLLVYKAPPSDYADYDKDSKPEPLPEDADRRYLRGTIFDLAKNQQGETGLVEMWLRPNYFRFQEAEADFMDLQFRLAEFGRETQQDEICDADEPAVCDGDEEVELEDFL
jgi:replicative DNA helicase